MSKENNNVREALKNLPSVDELIKNHQYDIPLILFKKKINLVLDQVRKKILNGDDIGNIQKYIDDKIVSSGGRVLNITSIGNNFLKIRKKIISNIKRLGWKNGFHRSDIGWRVINKNENYKRHFKR